MIMINEQAVLIAISIQDKSKTRIKLEENLAPI